jgi:hypothetical protein
MFPCDSSTKLLVQGSSRSVGEGRMLGGTVKRAYQLAPECRTLDELKARLVKEGCINIDAHLQGSVAKAVRKLLQS